MLNSQITLSARNIPTYAATRIRTKEPRQTMTEDALLAGWPDDAKAYRSRVAQTHPHTGRKMGSAQPGEGVGAQVLAILSPTKWLSVAQIRDKTGFGYNKARNALDRLVTSRDVERRIVENADGLRNRTYYRISADTANRQKRDAAMLEYLAEPRSVNEVAKFAGLSRQRVTYMLGEWLEQGKVTREWKQGTDGRGKTQWQRKEGGE